MNKSRNRKKWTPAEAKQRNRAGHEIEVVFNKFKGYYKNNELGN